MIDAVAHLHVVHSNPFIMSDAVYLFYKALPPKDYSLLLGYLVLPLILNTKSGDFLRAAKSTSSFRTLLKQPERVHGLDARVARFRTLTNETLQLLLSTQRLQLRPRVSLVASTSMTVQYPAPPGLAKAAIRLANLAAPHDVPTTYRMLGVMEL